jgi:hypothetical protein
MDVNSAGNHWAEAQREFRAAYVDASATLPRRRVHWRVTDRGLSWPGGLPVGQMLARVLRGKSSDGEPVIALWDSAATPGTPADLTLQVDPLPIGDEGDGEVVGRFEPNGVMCLELADGTTLWPTYNPQQPTRRVPRR